MLIVSVPFFCIWYARMTLFFCGLNWGQEAQNFALFPWGSHFLDFLLLRIGFLKQLSAYCISLLILCALWLYCIAFKGSLDWKSLDVLKVLFFFQKDQVKGEQRRVQNLLRLFLASNSILVF